MGSRLDPSLTLILKDLGFMSYREEMRDALLNEKDGDPLAIDLLYRPEDLLHQER
jgi:hypothetical protein